MGIKDVRQAMEDSRIARFRLYKKLERLSKMRQGQANVLIDQPKEDVQRFSITSGNHLYNTSQERIKAYGDVIEELRAQCMLFKAVGRERMKSLINMFVLLTFIAFIPSAIASLQSVRNQQGLGYTLLGMMIMCVVYLLLYIAWHRTIPALIHTIVCDRLLDANDALVDRSDGVDNNPDKAPPLYATQIKAEPNPSSYTYIPRPLFQHDRALRVDVGYGRDSVEHNLEIIKARKLEEQAISTARMVMIFQRIYPVLEVMNAVFYPLAVCLQLVIVVLLGYYSFSPQTETHRTLATAQPGASPVHMDRLNGVMLQWLNNVFIVIINIVFSLGSHSPAYGD